MNEIKLNNVKKHEYGANKGQYNWIKSAGTDIDFIYHEITGNFKIVKYLGNSNLLVLYNNHEYMIKSSDIVDCKLNKLVKNRTGEFKYHIGENINSKKQDFIIIDMEYKDTVSKNGSIKRYKYYKYICNLCGYKNGYIEENNLSKGYGCPCCDGKVVVEGINDIPTTAPWMVKYFQGGYDEAKLYTKSSNKKIYPICPDCGKIKTKKQIINNINKSHSIGCTCGDGISYPEKFISKFLQIYNIEYIYQLSKTNYIWCGKYYYDFYLPHYNCIIETHGIQHYRDSTGWNQNTKTIEETIRNDLLKKKLAIKNNIKHYIVIDARYSELNWIKNSIINSELFNIIKSKEEYTNWVDCEQFALKNICKEICLFRENNLDLTTGEIGKIFKLDVGTIRKYLKKGSLIGWCKYDSTKELARIRKFRTRAKPVAIIKDDVILGTFNSARELDGQSMKLFGVQLCYSSICQVCNGKYAQHKGFVFKYVEKLQESQQDSLLLCSKK